MKELQNTQKEKETFIPILTLKFGQLKHLQDLLRFGNLFVSSIENLRKDPNNLADDYRTDHAEGASKYVSRGPGTAKLISVKNKDNEPITLPFLNFSYFEKAEYILGNICSFYGITDKCFKDNELIPIDPKMKQFGSHFLIIKNFDEFIRRIDIAIERTTRTSWYYGYVEYFNEDNFDGNLHLFHKRSRFSYQKEFRIYFDTVLKTPMTINIGSIEDIAMILPSNITEHFQATLNLSELNCNLRWPNIG